MESLTVALDLIGTFVFALSGAMTGVRHRLDVFGLVVLAFAAGNAGGIIRDLSLGATPPAAIADWRYIVVSLLAGVVTFWAHPTIGRRNNAVLLLDAGGLGLFAVSGALKSLAFGLGSVGAVLLGTVSGIGGGMLRDVLVAEVPVVLRAELYAVAALVGAAVAVVGTQMHVPAALAAIVGALLCFGLRVLALLRDWQLPVARDEKTTN